MYDGLFSDVFTGSTFQNQNFKLGRSYAVVSSLTSMKTLILKQWLFFPLQLHVIEHSNAEWKPKNGEHSYGPRADDFGPHTARTPPFE